MLQCHSTPQRQICKSWEVKASVTLHRPVKRFLSLLTMLIGSDLPRVHAGTCSTGPVESTKV